ncbi:MAG: TonB-dependent receptor domain-containing protein [Vicinamibacteria bacterium]
MGVRLRLISRSLAIGLLVVCAPLAVAAQSSGQSGSGAKIVGHVVDEYNAMTLPMAPVEVVSTGEVVYTDLDGKYTINVAPGTYQIKATFAGYEEKTVEVKVAAGQVVEVDVVLGLEKYQEEVTVTATAIHAQTDTQETQLLIRRRASAIEDNIASEEMSVNADSNAADAMQRVTGLSVVGSQYIFVRGLGERYSNTTLNGAVLPTTEPDKRVVPLDLFPSGLIDSIQVQKTYLPDKPADFTGGLVQIEPIRSPDEMTLNFSISEGGNLQTTFDDFGTYPGGSLDWFTYDDGTRVLPGIIPDERVVKGSAVTGLGFTSAEIEEFGESFANVWEPRVGSAKPDQSYSVMWGNGWEKWGAVVSFTYNYRNQYAEEEQNYYKVGGGEADEITLQNDYDFSISTNRANLGLVGNLSYQATPNTRLSFENFYSHNSKNETRGFAGFNSDIRTDIRDSRLYWTEEGVLSNKLAGEHYLPGFANSRLDWHFASSRADRDEPDLREVLYEFDHPSNTFILADESQSGFRMFNFLDERIYDFGADWSFFMTQWGGLPAMLKVGPAFTTRDRDFSSRRFRYRPVNIEGVDLTRPPEELFTPENIGPVFEFREETRNTDTYAAGQDVIAGYGLLDLPLSEKWRFIGGARVEKSDQTVDTFDLFHPDRVGISTKLDNTDVLPGVSLVYQVTTEQNLRFGYGHTVNRPEFRELAPFEFTDVVGGRAVVGNPELRRALIKNVDVRWEWFPRASEVLAASFFYKDFTDPIEQVVQATAQLRTSYENALGATNKGFEIEARKGIGEHFFVAGNYTLVDSQIEIAPEAGNVQTSLERPLAGQSESIFNAIFEFRSEEIDLNTRVLYNYFGDRISDVGSLGLPDIIEEGRGRLDLVFSKGLGAAGIRVSLDNVLNETHLYTQGGEVQRRFELGRKIAFQFSYSFTE